MDYTKKIAELRNIINERLLPLIDNNYLYLELPYYSNIGDLLIWEGTLRFLSQTKHRCLYSTNADNFIYKEIDENVLILLQGGGNWGDLWVKPHNFRKEIIKMYPKNKVIIFPQTIYYQDEKNMLEDIEFYNKYPNVTICTRDKKSFNIMSKYFKNNKILLVPDMAFFINVKFKQKKTNRILFAKRTDKELSLDNNIYNDIPPAAEIYDWPTMDERLNWKSIEINNTLYRLMSFCRKIDSTYNLHTEAFIINFIWKNIIKPYYIKWGIKFINNYSEIYSTRLHITILSILMNKRIHIIDNNYGKTLSLIETWFTDEEKKYLL